MSTKFNRKPPLVVSPIRSRPRRMIRSATSMSVQTPPGSMTKSAMSIRSWSVEKIYIKPEVCAISLGLRALAQKGTNKNETEEKKNGIGLSPVGADNSPLFERGRFYDLYSARRNERLKRKLGIEMEDENKYDLGVTTGTMKRRDSKRLESGRKSLPMDLLVDRSQPPRYSLRSSKDNKKPLLSMSFDGSYGVDAGGKKSGSGRRAVRKI